jgi:hypothetical protein
MGSDNDECRGCISYGVVQPSHLYCSFPSSMEGIKCPCIDCIVKMICEEYHTCDDWLSYENLDLPKIITIKEGETK